MALRQYWSAIRKSWWIILIVALLGALGGYLVTLRTVPRYASTVTFFVSTPTSGGTSPLAADQFATRRITSYVGLLSSDVTAQAVIDATSVDLSVPEVRSEISGDADVNTVLLTATVTDSSPDRSLLIAQGLASEFGPTVNKVDPIGPDAVELRVISGPTLDPTPVSPRVTFDVLVGFALGLILGIVIALVRRFLDNTIRHVESLQELSNLPIMGMIPRDRRAKKNPLAIEAQARSVRAEAFRHLRTNLQFIDVDNPVKVVVFTSSVPHEAKSTTVSNVAVSFAESGQRVLLIEADLRRPRVADIFGLERSVGLTDVLAGTVGIDDVLVPWGRSGLTVLPSGRIPPNPAELLGSKAMLNLLTSLRRDYDLVVIDTPPLLPVADAAIAARHSDGVVLVVRYGKTTRNQVNGAIRSLRAVDARILGTVLTVVPMGGSDGYESYGSGYYGEDRKESSRDHHDVVPGLDTRVPEDVDATAPDQVPGKADRPA